MPATPRFVVLTYGGDVPQRLLRRLGLLGVVPEAVVVVSPKPGQATSAPSRIKRALTQPPRETLAALLRTALRRAAAPGPPGTRQASSWSGHARQVVHAGTIDEQPMLDALRALEPDWLLLASVGVLSEEALAIPRRGTLNAHHGLLPWLRGNGVVERALATGIPVGVTVHLVDKGIDTGAIVERRMVPVHEADSYESIHDKSLELGAEMLATLAERLTRGEEISSIAQTTRYPLGRWATPEEIAAARAAVCDGKALRVYLAWKEKNDGNIINGD